MATFKVLMSQYRRFQAILGMGLVAAVAWGQGDEAFERPPIEYSHKLPKEAVTRLKARLDSGQSRLEGTDREIVQRLLTELQIPVESQLLVFSKTSLQRERISPERPRSIFFSDTCYVGWVPGGLIEVTAIDPALGPVFYSLDPRTHFTNAATSLIRDSDCLRCHGGVFVRDIPSVFVRSVFPSDSGEPMLKYGSEVVDFRTPFTNRWGGWYVTGQHGPARHRGNIIAQEKQGRLCMDLDAGANVSKLERYFDTDRYLTNSSDIVALLVLEHQVAMQNTLTSAGMRCRRMLDYQQNLQKDFKQLATEELVYDSVKSVFQSAAREVVDDLLFRGEAELPPDVRGSAGFQAAFLARSIRAGDGSSLWEFNLKGRLFRNRCSYLIYSDQFRDLPKQLKQLIFDRLSFALRPANPDARYAYLTPDERARITRILVETCPGIGAAITGQMR